MKNAHRSATRRRLVAPLALLAVAAALVAGCGDSGSSGSPAKADTGSQGASAGVAEATAFVEKHLVAPTQIHQTEPVSKRPEPGKTVAFMDCGVPGCHVLGDYLKEALTAIGWKLTVINAGGTPENVSSGWDQVVNDRPDAVITAGTPAALWRRQARELEAAGIPVVNSATTDSAGDGILVTVVGEQDFVERGKWLANWVVSQTKGKANTLFVNMPDFPVLVTAQKAYDQELKRLCPSCSTKTVAVPASTIGTTLPSRVKSELQRDPSINYVVFGLGDMAIGVTQALKSAGFDAKVISQEGTSAALKEIKSGTAYQVVVPEPIPVTAWSWVDVLVRHFDGDQLPVESYQTEPRQFLTQDTIDNPDQTYPGVENYREQYLKLWRVQQK